MGPFTHSSRRCRYERQHYKAVRDACLPILIFVFCSDYWFTRMAKFPRWSRLKHFNSVTTTRFTDGNAFYDILKVIQAYVLIISTLLTISKCIMPCIADFLPRNSPLVHCIRAYITYRILVGLTCMTESRLGHLRNALKNYQKYCTVSRLVPQLEVCSQISESPGSRARI